MMMPGKHTPIRDMAKLTQVSLADLYAKPKITPSVEREILKQEDFSKISKPYCDAVCKLKCKTPNHVVVNNDPCDILLVQDHIALKGRYDRYDSQQEEQNAAIVATLAERAGAMGLRLRTTSLLKCKVGDADLAKGKAPAATTLLKCKPYLWEEIRGAAPGVIISAGTASTKALGFKNLSNGRDRGRITSLGEGDLAAKFGEAYAATPVVLTAHPKILSMIRQNAQGSGMWGADYFDVIERDFTKAVKLARGELKLQDLQASIEMYKSKRIKFCKSAQDVAEVMDIIDALPEGRVISFDTETNTLDCLDAAAKLLTIQFGWRDKETGVAMAAVIPLFHRKNTFYNPADVWPRIHTLLEGPRGKVAHNGKFDILMIYWTLNTRVRNLKFDTMLVLHSISSGNQGVYGLKAAIWDYLYDLGFAGYDDLLGPLSGIEDEDSEVEAAEVPQ
jgi:uracil-DNA glycosylase